MTAHHYQIPAPPPPQVQFGLKTILAITTAFSLLFAAGYWFGAAGYVGFFVIAAFCVTLLNPRMQLVDRLIACCAIVVVVALLLPAFQPMTCTFDPRSQCSHNLKQIGLGLLNYNDVYRCFPPAYVSDKNGKRMHSWRVLILPFMEQKALYDRYDFNEPWNGPHNSKLAKEMPAVFRCPSDTANPGTMTNYVAIVGPETIWQPDQGTTFKEIEDGSSQTIAVVEMAGAGIDWMAPRDLPFSAVAKGINPKQGLGMSSEHPGAVIALFADGHTQTIQERLPLELLKALCTKAGGETIGEDY